MGKVKDVIGDRYGDLVVVKRGEDYIPPSYPKGKKQVQWVCLCDCGNYATVNINSLRSGRQRSCGCQGSRHQTTHGMSNSITYKSWEAMIQRCTNPNHLNHKSYSEKGIHKPWVESFENFFKDMGERPSKDHSIDRIDNDKGYYPENCRWVTMSIQIHNRTMKGGSSIYKGVSFNKHCNKWEAYIKNLKTQKKEHLGFFDDESKAALSYNQKAKEYYKEFASLNEIKT